MLDFLEINEDDSKRGVTEISPSFMYCKSKDLMIRAKDFYAIWVEDRGMWSTDEDDAIQLIDAELRKYAIEYKKNHPDRIVRTKYLRNTSSGSIDKWLKYCQKQSRDHYVMLDEKIIFSNAETTKTDYASKRLSYPLEEGECPSWDKLIGTLYSKEEREKIEWAIGAIVSGDSKKIQKFMVLYGAAGTGKSTILNVIQQLFEGYYTVFDAKALGSANNSFALEAFKSNPLVAIQHDGDLSKIEDNTRLNSLVSHEMMTINEKFKGLYSNKFKCFLFMGTNKPVKITDGKSGLLRRLIDVTPSGNKIPPREYKQLTKQVSFELGSIAYKCKEFYSENKDKYDNYIPTSMIGASNDFYNFVLDSYHVFLRENGTTLKTAWERYKVYCDEAKIPYPFSQRIFKEELKNYFWEFEEILEDGGLKIRNYYLGFKTSIFGSEKNPEVKNDENKHNWLEFKEQDSIFDAECADCIAQYATKKESPSCKWDSCKTKLKDLDTKALHYVKPPESHIFVDFDFKDENGNKSFERNVEEASKWPVTYAELSKSGGGIHLHYIYTGDVSKLEHVYVDDENKPVKDIEIKVCTGNSALRRKLTKCNNLPIAKISSGLPLKGDEKVIDKEILRTEKGLVTTITKCLNKEVHAGTASNVSYIYKLLEDYYNSGEPYDISDVRIDGINIKDAIVAFAANSTHQADKCLELVTKMHFRSEDASQNFDGEGPIVFYDVEVFPNLFLINWKLQGEGNPVVRMINPTPAEVEDLFKFRLIGFNCRRYDNHILHYRVMGATNEELYRYSSKIISNEAKLSYEANNISYTDVYDFAAKKQSLKKWEIELGIHHQELGLPWDQPVPEEKWIQVAEYCDNDVIATEAVFNHLQGDFTARKILAALAGGTVNDTTNQLTTRIIFGSNRKPQDVFNYRNLAEKPPKGSVIAGTDIPMPYFPGYEYKFGKSTYQGEEVGEGGYVYAEPGMYVNVALLDIASMHPSSIIAEDLFGPEYTKRFKDIRDARVYIKHGDFESARTMLDGKLAPYLDDETMAADLAQALKIAINSVYGLTAAKFEHPFKDPRNIDNIVAKRGALFMVNLKKEVQKRGYTVAHIKTDSIKIPDADPEIIKFVMDYGYEYGYTFEHEATYERMCLVNDAVYIAKYKGGKHDGEWTPTGKQFAVPYVYKTLFSKEDICFDDMCETFSVSKGDIYLDTNEILPDVTEEEKKLDKLENDYKKGLISDLIFEKETAGLADKIATGHDYHFVGRVGRFCPIKPGNNAGVMYRIHEGKKYATPGSKGYLWLESEMVKMLNMEDCIDRSFYDELVDDAVKTISKYGDFNWFVSDEPYIKDWLTVEQNYPEEIPF